MVFSKIGKLFEEHRFISSLKYMTAEQAYSLTTVKHVTNAEDVFNTFLVNTIEEIKKTISDKYNTVFETLLYFPDYLNDSYLQLFRERMTELGYHILYSDNTICLISWRYLKDAEPKTPVKNSSNVEPKLIKG